MKVTVRKKNEFEEIRIYTDYIKLESALKLQNAVPSGGQAKALIQEGEAKVNGEVCTMRGKKLVAGDRIEFLGRSYIIVSERHQNEAE